MRSPKISHRLGLLAAFWLVHAAIATGLLPAEGQSKPEPKLPPAVVEMREAILDAVNSGRLEDLKVAVDLNELKPELAATAIADPIGFWRAQSGDGTGAHLLARVGALLEGPYSVIRLGKDIENNRQFVWPAFADKPMADLTAAEHIQLEALEPEDKRATMRAGGRYTGWRIIIGADGVWHAFRRYD